MTKHSPPFECGGHTVELSQLSRDDAQKAMDFAAALPLHDMLFLSRDIRHPKVVSAWIDAVEDGSITSLVAHSGGQIHGITALVTDRLGWSHHVADLRMVISTAMRGHGLGRKMLLEALKAGEASGAEKFIARMTPDQRGAIALFESAGFRAEALLRDHVKDPDGEVYDLVVMSLHLREYRRMQAAFGERE